MRYFDTGGRDPEHSLARWIERSVQGEVREFRLQTGFFSIEGMGVLIPAFERCRDNDWTTKILIGSNDAGTLRDDVAGLIDIMGVPRNFAQLGVVSFSGAYFHPKTYHIKRSDGSQAAFVGSANLTASGLALHVEAGIALDTNEGDDPQHLSEIASAIDRWFEEQREGFTLVSGLETLDELVANGVLGLTPPPRTSNKESGAGGTDRPTRPRLRPLVELPRVRSVPAQPDTGAASTSISPAMVTQPHVQAGSPAPVIAAGHPSSPRDNFPPYLLFAPNAEDGPTVGALALSGTLLPIGAVGLIVRLNKDSGRMFMGKPGTAVISIPVAALSTLRFGIYGNHSRPRAEFSLEVRYVSDGQVIHGRTANTNVMGYGLNANESGHGDVRMLVPVNARHLGEIVSAEGLTVPSAGDVALLEWPTASDPIFRLSFLDSQSAISQKARNLLEAAATAGQIVGNSACWLAAGVSPSW